MICYKKFFANSKIFARLIRLGTDLICRFKIIKALSSDHSIDINKFLKYWQTIYKMYLAFIINMHKILIHETRITSLAIHNSLRKLLKK